MLDANDPSLDSPEPEVDAITVQLAIPFTYDIPDEVLHDISLRFRFQESGRLEMDRIDFKGWPFSPISMGDNLWLEPVEMKEMQLLMETIRETAQELEKALNDAFGADIQAQAGPPGLIH